MKDILPPFFLTRKQLAFEEGAVFGLRIIARSRSTDPFNIVGATKEGPFVLSHTPDTTSCGTVEDFRLPDVPIWVSVVGSLGIHDQGMLHCQLELLLNGNAVQQLCVGFVYSDKGLSWPMTNVVGPELVKGELARIDGADPAAGAQIDIPVPSGNIWKILSMSFTFTTDATVAERRIHLRMTDPDNILYDFISPVAQTASSTKLYTCYASTPGGSNSEHPDIHIPIPAHLPILTAWRIRTAVTNMQAGDDFGVPRLYVERGFHD